MLCSGLKHEAARLNGDKSEWLEEVWEKQRYNSLVMILSHSYWKSLTVYATKFLCIWPNWSSRLWVYLDVREEKNIVPIHVSEIHSSISDITYARTPRSRKTLAIACGVSRKSRAICSTTPGTAPSFMYGRRREMQIIFVHRSGDCNKMRSICWPDMPFAPVITAVRPLTFSGKTGSPWKMPRLWTTWVDILNDIWLSNGCKGTVVGW